MLTNLLLRLTFVGAEWVLRLLLILSVISIALMKNSLRTSYDSLEWPELANQLPE